MCAKQDELPAHFKGKDALSHVAEAQAHGLAAAAEIHGTETPGHIAAGADAARETALVLLLLFILLSQMSVLPSLILPILFVFSCSWLVWKTGRSAWLGWSRLERLHRIVAQEKWEIDHHRKQEREELGELYAAKGFEGRLLEEVLDVLMADDQRLLRVMVEEELGLTLSTHEHPLKQALGAFFGALLALFICLIGLMWSPSYGLVVGALLVVAISGAILAYRSENRLIPAIVWNLGIGLLSLGFVYFLIQYFKLNG